MNYRLPNGPGLADGWDRIFGNREESSIERIADSGSVDFEPDSSRLGDCEMAFDATSRKKELDAMAAGLANEIANANTQANGWIAKKQELERAQAVLQGRLAQVEEFLQSSEPAAKLVPPPAVPDATPASAT